MNILNERVDRLQLTYLNLQSVGTGLNVWNSLSRLTWLWIIAQAEKKNKPDSKYLKSFL